MSRSYGAQSTTEEVLEGTDLAGRRILVTGVSAGLGIETARALAAHGAEVVGAARDLGKARAAALPARQAAEAAGGAFDLIELDLASLRSVRACAEALAADGRPFDVVIANAGVMGTPFGRTEDGFETQFGTNHLGHFVLVNRIAPLLRPGARVVVLASSGHRFSDVDLEDPNFDSTPYDPFQAYGRSKTANVLFAVELDRRHRARGVRAAAVHPGRVPTEVARHMSPEALAQRPLPKRENGAPALSLKTLAQGAATTVWAALVAPADTVGGRYCEDCQVARTGERDAEGGGVAAYALDPERARALWARSEELVGEPF